MRKHPLLDLENTTGTKLAEGKCTIGLFMLTGNAMIAEALGTLPIDWLIVDMEASPVTKEGALHMLQALNGSGVTPMIRVPQSDKALIEHALDIGAHGVLVPKVDTPAQARQVVDASRYPPQGRRGINPVRASGYFGNVTGYLEGANARTLCMIQIESVEAVQAAAEIAAVDGIDVLFIGAGDLACALGQPGIVTGERMDWARREVLDATRRHGKTAGIFAYGIELAAQYREEGFQLIAIGNEIKGIRDSVLAAVDHLSSMLDNRTTGRQAHADK